MIAVWIAAAGILPAGLLVLRLLQRESIRRWWSITFRPPLESDNLNDTLKVNRFLANPVFLILLIAGFDVLVIGLFSFCANVFCALPQMVHEPQHLAKFIGLQQVIPNPAQHGRFVCGIFYVFYGLLAAADVKIGYMIRISYSEKAMNKGNSGTSRWTTLKEVVTQYKEIRMFPSTDGKTNWFDGKGGIPVARWRDHFYIDSQLTNNLFLGATRSGKGEMFVFPMIDILSRAKEQRLRPSMIIFDPKLELFKSSFLTLKEREYDVRLLNLDNPMKSAGYNPLAIMAEYYKKGKTDEAQQLARSFAFAIFNSNADTQEPIWKNTATDLWTAMIIAHITDCIDDDQRLNAQRVTRFKNLRQTFEEYKESDEATEEGLQLRREAFAEVYLKLDPGEDFLDEDLVSRYNEIGIPEFIPDYIVQKINGKRMEIPIEYREIYPNERNINCFSALNFFKELVDTSSASAGDDPRAGAKKADTALDDYFNARPDLDYAKALYASIKSAGDRTKGSVYINMQSALSIFMQDNIARLTAESDIDIAGIGFNREHPTAVFIGLPTEDKANHFLALNFVTQVFQYLWKISKEGTNRLDREVQFILDEFGNMPVMDNFDGMVTNCLGAGMAFNIFIQSYNQLHAKYEMDMDTIKDNFANQFYILAVGKESANEFSEQLGNKTVVDVQRSGTVLSMKKNIMENNKERPLKFPSELQSLREGETALIRASKRTDRAGAGVFSFPILDEYQDHLYPWWYVILFVRKIILQRLVRKKRMRDRDTGKDLSALQEYRYWISYEKRRQGTAFLYRWQYATSDFPNPTDINFNEIFQEQGREYIDYRSRVMNVRRVMEALGIEAQKEDSAVPSARRIRDLSEGTRAKYVNWCSKHLGVDFREQLRLSEDMTITQTSRRITEYIDQCLPEEQQARLQAAGFIGSLNSILSR